jgi:hypothetical protein
MVRAQSYPAPNSGISAQFGIRHGPVVYGLRDNASHSPRIQTPKVPLVSGFRFAVPRRIPVTVWSWHLSP